MKARIYLFGSTGKMGTALNRLLENNDEAAFEKEWDLAEVGIDFSVKEAAIKHIDMAKKSLKPLVIGTTGLEREVFHAMEEASKKIPLFYAPNFSLGVFLTMQALKLFKKNLPIDTDFEMIETHHESKVDAPSGTSKAMAHILGMPQEKIFSIRNESTAPKHRVIMYFGKEKIELTHESFNRETYAKGALEAAHFIKDAPPGFYTMEDLLEKRYN